MEKQEAIGALVALGHETRLDIFRLLMQAGPDGLPAGRIGERLGLPPATLSFHLTQLKHADLVTFRRESRSLIYSAAFPVMTALLAYMTENCRQGSCEGAASSTCQSKESHETSARARVR